MSQKGTQTGEDFRSALHTAIESLERILSLSEIDSTQAESAIESLQQLQLSLERGQQLVGQISGMEGVLREKEIERQTKLGELAQETVKANMERAEFLQERDIVAKDLSLARKAIDQGKDIPAPRLRNAEAMEGVGLNTRAILEELKGVEQELLQAEEEMHELARKRHELEKRAKAAQEEL